MIHMAATGTSRPSATLIALVAFLAVLALATAPASASELNIYRGEFCTGGISLSCFDGQCCNVPSDAASFQFHYVPGFPVTLFEDVGCTGSVIAFLSSELECENGISFKSAFVSGGSSSRLKMATEE